MFVTPKPIITFRYIISLFFVGCCFFACSKKEYIYVQPPRRASADIHLSYFSDTVTRAWVTFTIEGMPVDVLFDTGSSGLRVLAGAIKSAPLDTDYETVGYGYSGGVALRGKVAGAHISIGGLKSSTPVKIMRIDQARPNTKAPYYPTGDSLHINNGLFRQFNGIVGVGMRDSSINDGVVSPLPQLPGTRSFIVHFPAFGQPKGQLILNPTGNELKGFSYIHLTKDTLLLPNGVNSWRDNLLKDSLVVGGVPYTFNALLDTGNPESSYYFGVNNTGGKVKPGTVVKFVLGQPPVASKTFTVSRDPTSGLDLVETSSFAVRDVFGIQFFFDYDVLYDQQHGLIGIRKK